MTDRGGSDPGFAGVSEAYGAARELLRRAEEDAARIRSDADRYRRQREQEAELIVAKARRLLTMAEQVAAAPKPIVVDVDAPAPEVRDDVRVVRDLDAGSQRTPSGLDAILANAVSNAIHRARPSEP